MMLRVLGWIIFLVLLVDPASAANLASTRPWPGVTIEQHAASDPPVRYFVATIDLTNPNIHLKVSHGGTDPNMTPPWETTLMQVSEMAARDGLAIAVNGNLFEGKDTREILGQKVPYFPGNWARTSGWAMSDGVVFSNFPADSYRASLVVKDKGEVKMGVFQHLPADARQVLSGLGFIITDGRIIAPPDNDYGSIQQPIAHTAVGIDRDGKTLFMFVVDGKRPDYSVGMTPHNVADHLLQLGAWNALMMDSGGSTTMVVRDPAGTPRVINEPSDGHGLLNLSVERNVADALGVIIGNPSSRPSQ
jgi:exopolysaccharide biosynthesis protein